MCARCVDGVIAAVGAAVVVGICWFLVGFVGGSFVKFCTVFN
jgi:hypothetical protein